MGHIGRFLKRTKWIHGVDTKTLRGPGGSRAWPSSPVVVGQCSVAGKWRAPEASLIGGTTGGWPTQTWDLGRTGSYVSWDRTKSYNAPGKCGLGNAWIFRIAQQHCWTSTVTNIRYWSPISRSPSEMRLGGETSWIREASALESDWHTLWVVGLSYLQWGPSRNCRV